MVTVLLRFCKAPRNDEITLQHFFFFLTAAQKFFSLHLCYMQSFFFRQALAGNFFFKIPPLICISLINPQGWYLQFRCDVNSSYYFQRVKRKHTNMAWGYPALYFRVIVLLFLVSLVSGRPVLSATNCPQACIYGRFCALWLHFT